MKNLLLMAAASALAISANAQEQTNSSNIKAADVTPAVETQKDIDQEITNARMRATLGSKSKWSLKSALTYNGGSLERPVDRVRPAYRAGATTPALTSLSGTVGIKYSLDERSALALGTGVNVLNPFHGDLTRSVVDDARTANQQTDRFEVSTPSLGYSRAYKVSGLQNISDITYYHATTTDAVRDYNAIGDVILSQVVLMPIAGSGWEAGVSFQLDLSFYRGDLDSEFHLANPNARQSDFSYGLYPFAEYSFNDRYSFRTVFGYFEASHYRDGQKDSGAVDAPTPYQSMGIGISVARDLYLYPNIQFTPLDIRPERTNVALSANINMF